MKRLKITIQIGSPILQPKYPINLDGLLYWAFKANSDLDDNAILAKIDTVLDKDPEMVNCINDIKAKLETIDSDVIDKLEGYGAEDIATIKEQGKSIEKIMTDAGL